MKPYTLIVVQYAGPAGKCYMRDYVKLGTALRAHSQAVKAEDTKSANLNQYDVEGKFVKVIAKWKKEEAR